MDEEESADMNQDNNIFDLDEYYNYNEILNPYFNRQFVQLTFDGISENLKNILSSEK